MRSKHLAILEHASVNPAEAALADEVPVAEHVGGLLHLLEGEHHRAAALLRRRALLLGLPQLGRLVHPCRVQRTFFRPSRNFMEASMGQLKQLLQCILLGHSRMF